MEEDLQKKQKSQMSDLERIRDFQRKLYLKAKQNKTFRFYPNKAKRNLRYYLFNRLQRYYKRKSQRKSKLYRRKAYDVLIHKYGLIDPTKYSFSDIL